jgi:hypothetical protein
MKMIISSFTLSGKMGKRCVPHTTGGLTTACSGRAMSKPVILHVLCASPMSGVGRFTTEARAATGSVNIA